MDCFHDFCLYCDRDSPNGAYCSQQCKLADLERSSNSNLGSPSSPTTRQSWGASPHRQEAYHYRQSSTPGYEAPITAPSSRPRSSYFAWTPSHPQAADAPTASDRQLTPSSSRTSLSSVLSASAVSSVQAKQLEEYFMAFDAAKKRRTSLR